MQTGRDGLGVLKLLIMKTVMIKWVSMIMKLGGVFGDASAERQVGLVARLGEACNSDLRGADIQAWFEKGVPSRMRIIHHQTRMSLYFIIGLIIGQLKVL